MISAYLDTCTISGLARGDLPSDSVAALLRILQFQKAGKVKLLTSAVTMDEINRIPTQHRTPHEAIYTLLAETPVAKTHQNMAHQLSLLGVGGGVREDPLFTKLKGILPDEADANHVFQAVKNDVEYFITADQRSILRLGSDLEECCKIKASSPGEFVEVVEKSIAPMTAPA